MLMGDGVAVEDGTRGLSELERVVDTFVAPTKTFQDILRSTSWWLPFVLLVASTIGTAFMVDRKVGFDQAYQNQVHASQKLQDRMASLTPEQQAQGIKMGAMITKYFSYAAFVLVMIFLAFYSLILWATFNVGLGAKTTYPQVFAVSMYSGLPYLVTAVLTMITLCFSSTAEGYDYKYPIGTSPAYFLTDVAPWLRALLGSLDVVKLWCVVLQVIGMAVIAKKTIAQSAVVVGLYWFLGVLIAVVGGAFS
jgi:hypothetical protein